MSLVIIVFSLIIQSGTVNCLHKNRNLKQIPLDTRRKFDKKTFRTEETVPSISQCISQGIDTTYHGGDIMHSTVNLYNIYVGHSNNDYELPYFSSESTSTVGVIEKFARGLSKSTYANILTSYVDSKGDSGANTFNFKGNSFVTTSKTVVTDDDIIAFVAANMTTPDPNGIYSVFFRGDISYNSTVAGEWNNEWCAFHSNSIGPINGQKVIIQPIGDEAFVYNDGKGGINPTSVQISCMTAVAGTSTTNLVGKC